MNLDVTQREAAERPVVVIAPLLSSLRQHDQRVSAVHGSGCRDLLTRSMSDAFLTGRRCRSEGGEEQLEKRVQVVGTAQAKRVDP